MLSLGVRLMDREANIFLNFAVLLQCLTLVDLDFFTTFFVRWVWYFFWEEDDVRFIVPISSENDFILNIVRG